MIQFLLALCVNGIEAEFWHNEEDNGERPSILPLV